MTEPKFEDLREIEQNRTVEFTVQSPRYGSNIAYQNLFSTFSHKEQNF